MFDACDFALFGMALPPVAREFGLNQAQAGLLATVGLVGAFLGALFWGTISDYIGRRTSFAATIGIFSLFTGLVGASWNVLSLSVFRFLSNFGLGGEVPVALTLTSEYSPGRIRGRMTGSMMAAFPVGLALAALLAYFIIPTYGWRAVFIIGVVPAVLLFFVRLCDAGIGALSVSRGRVAEAERTVAEIESEGRRKASRCRRSRQSAPADVEERGVTVFELLTPERRKRTILLWIVSFCFLWSSNGIIFMLPKILVQRGFRCARSWCFCWCRRSRPSSATQRAASSSTATAAGRCCSSITSSARSSTCGSPMRSRHVALCRHRRGRLGQSRRLRLDRHLCQRALSDASARDGGRLVLRHRPDRLVPGAGRGRLHAAIRAGAYVLHTFALTFFIASIALWFVGDRDKGKTLEEITRGGAVPVRA